MTILDFPTGGRASRTGWPRSSHPTAALRRPSAPDVGGLGDPPTGAWLDAYEQLAA